MSLVEGAYTAALTAARPLLPLAGRGAGKLARGVRGRRGVVERLARWAREQRDPGRPLVWFHAPSVGEGLQARITLQALRARRPELQVLYTYFSPSAERFATTVPADVTDYLPLDLPAEMAALLDALRPAAVAFSKTDVWPNLTREAARRGVPLLLLSATLPPGSSRLSAPARLLLGPAYRRLRHVAAISPADAERFGRLGVPPERRSVMGDARFDQVWARAQAADPDSPLLAPLRATDARPTLVAGSTWSPDEERLLSAVARLRDEGTPLRLVLVPHEPTPEHLARTEALLARLSLVHRRLSHDGNGWEVLLVDRVGVLGDLYALADLAYVGGGWGTAGLHSVLEPAAFGAPVLFGPRHANAREAGELVARGGAFAPVEETRLLEPLRLWTTDAAARQAAGAIARDYVRAGLGAAARGAALVEGVL